jgi:hypothetical protein
MVGCARTSKHPQEKLNNDNNNIFPTRIKELRGTIYKKRSVPFCLYLIFLSILYVKIYLRERTIVGYGSAA